MQLSIIEKKKPRHFSRHSSSRSTGRGADNIGPKIKTQVILILRRSMCIPLICQYIHTAWYVECIVDVK